MPVSSSSRSSSAVAGGGGGQTNKKPRVDAAAVSDSVVFPEPCPSSVLVHLAQFVSTRSVFNSLTTSLNKETRELAAKTLTAAPLPKVITLQNDNSFFQKEKQIDTGRQGGLPFCLSKDQQWAVQVKDDDKTAKIRAWNARTGPRQALEFEVLDNHHSADAAYALSSDARFLACAVLNDEPSSLQVYDLGTGVQEGAAPALLKEKASIEMEQVPSTSDDDSSRIDSRSLSFSPDGSKLILTTSDPNTLSIWDAATGTRLHHKKAAYVAHNDNAILCTDQYVLWQKEGSSKIYLWDYNEKKNPLDLSTQGVTLPRSFRIDRFAQNPSTPGLVAVLGGMKHTTVKSTENDGAEAFFGSDFMDYYDLREPGYETQMDHEDHFQVGVLVIAPQQQQQEEGTEPTEGAASATTTSSSWKTFMAAKLSRFSSTTFTYNAEDGDFYSDFDHESGLVWLPQGHHFLVNQRDCVELRRLVVAQDQSCLKIVSSSNNDAYQSLVKRINRDVSRHCGDGDFVHGLEVFCGGSVLGVSIVDSCDSVEKQFRLYPLSG